MVDFHNKELISGRWEQNLTKVHDSIVLKTAFRNTKNDPVAS